MTTLSGTPSNPYHIARAYEAQVRARTSAPGRPGEPRAASGDPIPSEPSGSRPALRRLVAGAVPGRIDFTVGGARPAAGDTLPMYRHPADRNAAATSVSAGRSIDVRG